MNQSLTLETSTLTLLLDL